MKKDLCNPCLEYRVDETMKASGTPAFRGELLMLLGIHKVYSQEAVSPVGSGDPLLILQCPLRDCDREIIVDIQDNSLVPSTDGNNPTTCKRTNY